MSKLTDIDGELVKKLAGLLDETKLTEIEYSVGEFRLRVTRAPAPVQTYAAGPAAAPVAQAAASAPAAEADPASHPGAVTSPMVGTVYLSPQPGAAVFMKVGDTVTEGKAFGTIESVKTLSDLYAPISGKVVKVNADLTSKPELVNEDCYGKAWMIVVAATDRTAIDALMDAKAYGEYLKTAAH